MEELRSHIEHLLSSPILNYRSLSGGSIAAVYQLETATGSLVLKTGKATAGEMFYAEANGLDLIRQTKTIAVPKVFDAGVKNDTAFLLMAYISGKSPSSEDEALLGTQLANLHRCNAELFGLNHDNFIGSLAQKNSFASNWADFFANQRLGVQLKLAQKKNLLQASEVPSITMITSVLQSFCKNIKASLLHGDLWNGNFLISKSGMPFLIDPAVYYGHAEVDIAMSKLFGGFGSSFYESYHKWHPKTAFFKERIDLYQLYYLLVHLNLFGRSYYNSVKRLLTTYF